MLLFVLATAASGCGGGSSDALREAVREIAQLEDPSAIQIRGPGERGMDGPYARIWLVKTGRSADALIDQLVSTSKCSRSGVPGECVSASNSAWILSLADYTRRFSGQTVSDDQVIEEIQSRRLPADAVILRVAVG